MQKVSPYATVRNKSLGREEIRSNIHKFVTDFLQNNGTCINPRNRRPTACHCLDVFRRNEVCLDGLIQKLEKYERKKSDKRQLFLHGVLTHAHLRQKDLRRGEKKTAVNALTGVLDTNGETVHICNNALQCLLCLGPQTWKKIKRDAMLPERMSTENFEDNVNANTSCTQRAIDFLYDIFKEEGETHATRIMRFETRVGLRDNDYKLMHLPSYYSKRKLYERFCFTLGWEVKSASDGSYPPLSDFKKRVPDNTQIDDETYSIWPEGTESIPVCSWHTFLRIWKTYLPNLKIRPPSLDTCDLCNEYAKYISTIRPSQMETFSSFLNNDPLICPETGEESLLKKGFGDLQESRENVVLLAAKHVAAAVAQKELARLKFDAANATITETNPSKKTITLVMDFCQNLDLPHLGGEQPGDTYYFSPLWVYCLGIYDVAEDRLYAYMYDESSAKKGANNVASILLYHIISFVLNHYQYCEEFQELNLIMDNCGGQNKNGTVLKMAAYFVERRWFQKVNLIFLVKGHTKNDCDRMFNLLKAQWHKSNVYTFDQALDILAAVENVDTIDARDVHIDYTKLFDNWYKQPVSGTIQKNHIFSFDKATIKNCVMTTKQSHNSEVTSTQSIKKVKNNFPDWIRALDILNRGMNFVPKPGLKPIKQVHLYTKWRRVVPHPYKDVLCPLPPNEIIQMVMKKKTKTKKKTTPSNTPKQIINLASEQSPPLLPPPSPIDLTSPSPIRPANDVVNTTVETPQQTPPPPSLAVNDAVTTPSPPKSPARNTEEPTPPPPSVAVNDAVATPSPPKSPAAIITFSRNTEEPRMQQPDTIGQILDGERKTDASSNDDDSNSEYVDHSFDPTRLMLREPRPQRGKTFLPPKPAAAKTKEEKKELFKIIADDKKKTMDKKKETAKKRMTTRNQKRLEREKLEPPAKRLRSRRRPFYTNHNTSST